MPKLAEWIDEYRKDAPALDAVELSADTAANEPSRSADDRAYRER